MFSVKQNWRNQFLEDILIFVVSLCYKRFMVQTPYSIKPLIWLSNLSNPWNNEMEYILACLTEIESSKIWKLSSLV